MILSFLVVGIAKQNKTKRCGQKRKCVKSKNLFQKGALECPIPSAQIISHLYEMLCSEKHERMRGFSKKKKKE